MIETITVVAITTVLSGLITFSSTMVWTRGSFEKGIEKAIKVHEEMWHKDSMYKYVESEFSKHKSQCPASKRFEKLEGMVKFMYIKAGGNIEDVM